jgi:hypothetical protein
MHVTVNLAKMFDHREPWDCSNSQANLGDQAGRLTWRCATEVAESHADWLVSPMADALEAITTWAKAAGAWEDKEIEAWSDVEALALLVQNIASDMRLIGSDDLELEECLQKYTATDWDKESEYPLLQLYKENDTILGQWYGGI